MSKNNYGNMQEFIESVFTLFQQVYKKAETQKDKRFQMIALTIYNYIRKMAIDYNVDLSAIEQPTSINLVPIFDYIQMNNIELYDFSKIDINDVDVTKAEDLERFVLTHIYYITQPL